MSDTHPTESGPTAVNSARGALPHIEKGWTVYDAVARPIGNVTEVDVARDVLTVDGRPQGFGAYEVPLGYVDRAADNEVYLTRAVDTSPGAVGDLPTFIDPPATTSTARTRPKARSEPTAPVPTPMTNPTSFPTAATTTTTTSRAHTEREPVAAASSSRAANAPYTAENLHEFTPAYATTQPLNPGPTWTEERDEGWSASKLAMAGLSAGALAAVAYVLRRRMRRKSAFERFVDLASDYTGMAGSYAGVASDFARQRNPAWWASLAAAAIPLAYYAWPSSKPTYTEQARGRADDFSSYLASLTGAIPALSGSESTLNWQAAVPAVQRAIARRSDEGVSVRPDVAGAIGALAAGALTVYAIRRMTSKTARTRVSDVMTRQPRVIQPDATVADAAIMMRRLDVGALPVCDGTRLIGMLTDRDITVRSTADGRDPHLTAVRDVMSPGVAWATEDDFVEEAARIMREHRIRRLPIVDDRHSLVGVVSLGDLAVDVHDDDLSGDTLERISEKGTPGRDWK